VSASIIVIITAVIFLGAVKLKVPLGLSFFICAILLAALSGMPVGVIPGQIGKSLIDYETIRLVGVVYLLTTMGRLLSELGWLTRTVNSLQTLIGDRRISAVTPASIIGLLPMPGGAMLSAPLVKEGAKSLNISSEKLTFLNFWFRHLWEYVWPLYPGLILSSAILELPVGTFVKAMWPLTVAAIISGILFGFRGIEVIKEKSSSKRHKLKAFLDFIKITWYIWVVVLFVLALGFDVFPIVALCVLIMLLIVRKNTSEKLSILRGSLSWRVLTMLAGVMIFKGVLEASNVLETLAGELSGIPPAILLFTIPFSIGLLTGVNSAYVGLGFPLLAPLIFAGEKFLPGSYTLAYAAGFYGVLLSPVHLCLLLTKQYFNAEWKGIYKHLLPATSLVYLVAITMFILKNYVF